MDTKKHAPQDRRGHTLLEMLVVVGVLTTVAALCWPAMRGPLKKSRLREAGKQLRSELTHARLKAIESGTSQCFQYQPGTAYFRIAPTPLTDPETSQETAFSASDTDTDEAGPRILSEEVYFCGAEEMASLLPDMDEPALEGEGEWSEPILFYPNGRTTDARIRLASEPDLRLEVSLRGLTGIATVSPIEHLEALP